MANIGNIPIPTPTLGSPFPITPDYPHSVRQDYSIATHTFGSANRKISQRYLLGTGSRLFTLTKQYISVTERNALRDHWETNKGPTHQFLYAFPDTDQATTTNVLVRYESEPLVWDVSSPKTFGTTVQLREVIESGPSLSVTSTVTRYPSGGLPAALLGQAQLLIPLVKITVREAGYPVIYLSDRLITVGGQLYEPRLTDWDGISQTLGSGSDDAGFSFGNADLVFTLLANDVDLVRASIEFSLLHLSAFDGSGTNTKIDLWKGEINSWEDQEDSTEFKIRASNILYELTLPWPPRLVERGCWKPFDDGVACPFTTQGTLDTVNYPSASGSSCDKGFFTPNGCAAHTMHRYHGGIQAEPQGVLIKNNATGTWGIGRELVNSTSLINDSAYGQPIPTVYTDSPMPVAALVVSGRDESDFYEALGVVSEGPVTFATPSGLDLHTLDGQPHHGHPGSFGLRTIPGNDPAGATDFFSLDQSGNQVGSNPQLIHSGGSTYRNVFAAGTSALVIRRTDEKGIQLTRPTDHQMTAIVSQGKQGWVWTAPSTRSLATLTNPVWIAINAFLRALGLENASAAVAETYFDVGAAIASAAICDTTVSKIAGLSGTETQFKFRGTVRDRKYLGDWLTDILDNCLAYMVNTFGKLKIGMRVNSSVVEAFTVANTLIDSLRLYPISPTFNHIVVEFDDELFNYQRNTIHVEAADHKALTGKTLTKTKSLVGTSGASQAGRIASVLLKEELGGATLAEWRKARTIRFKTTILALNVEPGMVCSMTHERMPDGAGEFRVYGWQLNKDFSIDVEGRTTTDAIYDLAQGPKPADVLPSAIPIEQVQYPRRPGWMAGVNRGSASDPIQGFQEFSILAGEAYETNADGSVQALVTVTGLSPRNRFLSVPPTIIRTITPSTASGTIPAGNWWVSVAPYKNATAGKQFGPPSNLLATNLSAAGKITIGGITWPEPPSGSWDGYTYMLGDSEQSLCQNDIASAPPSSIEIDFERRFSQALQPNISKVRAKVKLCPWPGIVRGAVSSVTSTTIVVGAFAGGGDAFSGRRLSIISDDSSGTPGVWNFSCSAYDEPTGTFTVTPDPTVSGIGAGDMLVVLTSPSSITSTGYSDTAYNFTTDELIGYTARILYGTGRGQSRTIVSNTATGIVVEPAWTTNPDSTSVIVVEEAGWGYWADSSTIESETAPSITISVPTDNLAGAVLLVAGMGVDTFDVESPESASPMRLLYIKGEPGTGSTPPPADVVPIGPNDFEISVALDYSSGVGVPAQTFSIEYAVVDPIDTLAGVTAWVVPPDGEPRSSGDFFYNGDPLGVGAARHGTFVWTLPLASSPGEDWDFYLTTWSPTYRNPLDLATSPKRTITALSSTIGLVTSFSISANYSDDGSVLVVEPTFTPPAADPNFWYAEIWMKTPYWEGQLGESDGSEIQFLVGGGFPPTPPGTDETWDFYAVSVGRDQTKNPPSFDIATPSGAAHATALITPQPVAGTPPALPSLVVGSHIASGQDATTQQLRVKLRAAITYPVGSTATIVQIWLSLDDGVTWEFAVNDEAMATVDFWWAAPSTTVTTAKLKVITANVYGWNDPATAVVSAAFTVTAGQLVAATSITDATIVGGLQYTKNSDGQWVWGFRAQWTNPSSDPQFFTTKLYVRKIDISGSPSSDWEGQFREVAQRAENGTVNVTEYGWRIPQPTEAYPYYGLYLFCVNQTFQESQQTTAWGGNPYLLINPQEPTGSSGYEFASHVTSPSASTVQTTDEQGALVFRFEGSCTPPADAAFGGVRIVARTAGGVDIPVVDVPRPSNIFASLSFVGPPMAVPEAGETYTVYFISVDTFNRANTLVPGTTPSVAGIVVQRTPGASGQEAAPLVTGFFAYSPAAVGYYGEDGAQRYQLSGTLTPPSSGRYKGCLIKACPKGTIGAVNGSSIYTRVSGGYFFAHHVNQRIDVAGVQMTITSVISPTQIQTDVTWVSTSGTWVVILLSEARIVADIGPTDTIWNSLRYEVQHDSEEMRMYAISYDYSGRENSLVPGTTPQSDVTINRLTGTSGKEYSEVVTNVVASESSPGIKCIVITEESGVTGWLVSGTCSEPTGERAGLFGGVKVCRLNPSNPNGSIEIANAERTGTGTLAFRSAIQPTLGAANVPIIFLSYDTSGRINTYVNGVTPEFTAITPAQGVTLNLAKIDPSTMNTAPIASYIIPPMNLANLPALPSASYPAGRMVYRTSDNTMWRVSTSGFSWENIPLGNAAFFKSITAGQISAGAIGTYELAAQEILVGSPSGGGGATKFRVNDSIGNMVCAIGDFGTFKGFYAINARIGPNINAPNFYADGTQVYMQNVPITINANGVLTSMNNQFAGDDFYGLAISNNIGVSCVKIAPGKISITDTVSGGSKLLLHAPNGANAYIGLYNASAQESLTFSAQPSGRYPTSRVFDGVTLYNGRGGGFSGIYSLQVTTPSGTRTLWFVAGLLINDF